MRLHEKNPIAFGILLFAGVSLSYFLPNQLAFFPVHLVPLTAPDRLVPLQPGWIWVYLSYYPFMAGAYLLAPTPELRLRFAKSLLVACLLSAAVFILWPSRVDRSLYPVAGAAWPVWALLRLRAVDIDVNCLPSMHVAMSFLSAFAYLAADRRRCFAVIGWAMLIAYSTMATKQHYFLDVVAGGVLALASAAIIESGLIHNSPRGESVENSGTIPS